MTERSRRRVIATVAIVAIAAFELLLVAKLIPSAGSPRHGAPPPILFQGFIFGLIGSLTAAGIILIYRSVRVINFAQTAIGGAGFALTYNFIALTKVPFPIAFALGLLVAGGVGLVFELVLVRRFFKAPRLVLTVFTIVAASLVAGFAKSIADSLPIFPDPADRTVAQISGNTDLTPFLPFSKFHFTLPGSPSQFGFIHAFAIVASIAALVGLGIFLRFTKTGVAVRALAENSERAALLGIGVGFISAVVWTISGLLSGVGSTLQGLMGSASSAFGFAPELLLSSLAAAVLGRMKNISVAVVASVGIEMMRRALNFLQPDLASLMTGALFVIIVGGLLLQRKTTGRSEVGGEGSWAATEEIRPIPSEMAKLTPIRVARWLMIAIALAGVIVFPFLVAKGQVVLGSIVALNAIIGLSLVVLTGWTGQVSLGQFALAAIGAVIAGALATKVHLPFYLVIPLAAALTAGVAMLIGLPALRLPGLHLAVATFALAAAVRDVLFNEKVFGWLLTQEAIRRPSLPFLNFEDDRAMYFFCMVSLALAVLAVRNLRASRFGRILIGMRENEANAQSAGISPLLMKLTGFALAGGLAGFAGSLLAFLQRSVSPDSFAPTASIDIFVTTVIGGISSVFGPLVGAGVINGISVALAGAPEVAIALIPILGVVILYIAPGGLISVAAKIRDTALRIIAQRNQIIVPSLFADIDPEALHLRLVPLAAPLPSAGGLSSLDRRYDLVSTHSDTRVAHTVDRDADALGAAARAAEGNGSAPRAVVEEVLE